MKKLLSFAVATVVALVMFAPEAEARRLGGGGSFGMSRSTAPVQRAAPAPTAPTNTAAAPTAAPAKPAAAPTGGSRWLGPIAGLAAGIGLAALLSHFGLGEGFANMLMILLLVMGALFVFRMLLRKSQPSRYAEWAPAGNAPGQAMRLEPALAAGGGDVAHLPAGFDAEGFVRQAKLNFIRLQAANDAGNLDDMKQFLAPEVFAEIQMQFEERGKGKQETDVQQLDAAVLEVVTEGDQHIASVRFSGVIREDGSTPAPFAEIWHLAKPVSGERGWQVAGIQQIQ